MKRNEQALARTFAVDHRREELYALLERQVKLYTMGESDSLPVEIVEGLLGSIRFCMEVHLLESGKQADDHPLSALFEAGQRAVWRRTEEGKGLLRRARQSDPGYGSLALRDTLEAVEEFFHLYDLRFFAQEIPCMIDYPLCLPVADDRMGILFINDYLERLLLEQRFCRCFGSEESLRLLKAFHPEYRVLVVNLLEPVLAAALGLTLLGRDPAPLLLDNHDGHRLHQLFRPWEEARARDLVSKAASRLCARFGLWDTAMRRYLLEAAEAWIPLLRGAAPEGFRNLFVCR